MGRQRSTGKGRRNTTQVALCSRGANQQIYKALHKVQGLFPKSQSSRKGFIFPGGLPLPHIPVQFFDTSCSLSPRSSGLGSKKASIFGHLSCASPQFKLYVCKSVDT